jgi:two-component system cell cycle sensor histidine kinase PleC
MSGHAKLFAQPAYDRLIGAEPFLKRLIPVLIVAFLVVVAAARYINISENRDRLRFAAEQMTALSLAAAVRATVGRSGARCARACAGRPRRASTGHRRNARYDQGRYLLVLGADERVFRGHSRRVSPGRQAGRGNLLSESSPLWLFGERAGVQKSALTGNTLAALSRLPDGAGAMLSLTPISDMNDAWRQSVSVNVTLFIATSSILLVILYAYFSQAGRAQEADEHLSGKPPPRRHGPVTRTLRPVGLGHGAGPALLVAFDVRDPRASAPRQRDFLRRSLASVHPDDGDLYEIAQMVASGDIKQVDHLFRMRHADGHYLWMRARAQVVDPTSAQTHLIGIAMDVTEQHRLQQRTVEADQRLFDAIESTSEAFVLWDRDDRLVLWNKHYQEIHGLPADSLAPGTPGPWSRMPRPARWSNGAWLSPAPAILAQTYEVQLGDGRWLQINERKTRDGGQVSVGTDITPLKRNQERLRDSEKRLDGDHRRPHLLAGRTQAQGRRALRTQPRLPDRDRTGGGGKQGQVRVPGQYEPRIENTAQRHYRFFRSAAGAHVRPAGLGQIQRICRRHPQFRHSPADRDQRHSRHGQNRGRSDAPRARGRRSGTAA